MVNKYEQEFVSKCIVKRMQERLLFELNGKKRINGIGRFSHNTDNLITVENIILKSNQISKDEIISLIGKFQLTNKCYIVAYNVYLDKVNCSFLEALELVLGNGMPAIIISDNYAVIETEQCCGTPTRYIVKF